MLFSSDFVDLGFFRYAKHLERLEDQEKGGLFGK